MKKLITIAAPILLAACTTMGDVEKQALKDRAIADARNQPKEIHLAYNYGKFGISDFTMLENREKLQKIFCCYKSICCKLFD